MSLQAVIAIKNFIFLLITTTFEPYTIETSDHQTEIKVTGQSKIMNVREKVTCLLFFKVLIPRVY